MKQISEKAVRAEASRGKNEPMARSPRVAVEQNGETEPTEDAARKQPGTGRSTRPVRPAR